VRDHSIVTIYLTLKTAEKSNKDRHRDEIGIKPGQLGTIPAASPISLQVCLSKLHNYY
jgi:hypothetical protein